jgi:hypothetical protein
MAIPIHTASFEDPHHFDADPDPDPSCDFVADPDAIFYLMRFRIRIRILASK